MALQTTTIKTQINGTVSGGSGNTLTQATVNDAYTDSFAPGAVAGLVNAIYSATRVVNTSTPDDIDLNALTDPLGTSINFAYVDAIAITNLSVTAGEILTIGGASHDLSANLKAVLNPGTAALRGGRFVYDCPAGGFAVTNGATDIIRVSAAAGAAVSYSIVILGRHV